MVHKECVGNWPETGKYCCPMCYPPTTEDPRVQSTIESPQLSEDAVAATPPFEYEELVG